MPQPVPDLVSLDLLKSVAALGSIRQAAQEHGISQPAASMRLRSLERTLGLTLLDRSTGGTRLTPEGHAVTQWAESVLEAMVSLVSGTAALREVGRAHLHLAASLTVAEYLMPRWLQRLRTSRMDLSVSLQMGNSEQVIEMVGVHEVDLGFIEGASKLRGLKSRIVAADQLVVVVGPDHQWARRRGPLRAEELGRTPLVSREVGSGTREVLETALAAFGYSVIPLVELASTTAIKASVASGTGPAVLSQLAVEGDLADGRLIAVPVDGLLLDRPIRAVWSRSRPLTASSKQLLAAIEETQSAPKGY